MTEGNIFLFPKSEDDHMWTIISDPVIDRHNVVIVKFHSFNDYPDQQRACVIYAGEHRFFSHATYVDFAGAYLTTDAKLESLKRSGHLKLRNRDLGSILLAKIRAGVPDSRIPLECEKVLEAQGLLPG
jgi:hypothetical protein